MGHPRMGGGRSGWPARLGGWHPSGGVTGSSSIPRLPRGLIHTHTRLRWPRTRQWFPVSAVTWLFIVHWPIIYSPISLALSRSAYSLRKKQYWNQIYKGQVFKWKEEVHSLTLNQKLVVINLRGKGGKAKKRWEPSLLHQTVAYLWIQTTVNT